jgi:hypothetical protein
MGIWKSVDDLATPQIGDEVIDALFEFDDTVETLEGILGGVERGLSDMEKADLRRLDVKLRAGGVLSDAERLLAQRLIGNIGEASGAGLVKFRAMDTLLGADGMNFTDDFLNARYLEYRRAGNDGLPLEWLRELKDGDIAKEMTKSWLGSQGAAIEFAENVDDYLRALRREASGGIAGVGRSWDYDRFPTRPPGKSNMWKIGDPVDMPHFVNKEHYPSYGTARRKYWQNALYYEIINAKNIDDISPMLRKGFGLNESISEAAERHSIHRGIYAASENGMNAHRIDFETLIGMKSDPDALREALGKVTNSPKAHFQKPDGTWVSGSIELEHNIPQRMGDAWANLFADGADKAWGRRLLGQSDPRHLIPVFGLEHSFYDAYAHSIKLRANGEWAPVGGHRASAAGPIPHWTNPPTTDVDIRLDYPLYFVPEANLRTIYHYLMTAEAKAANPKGLANFDKLVDACEKEISRRHLKNPTMVPKEVSFRAPPEWVNDLPAEFNDIPLDDVPKRLPMEPPVETTNAQHQELMRKRRAAESSR